MFSTHLTVCECMYPWRSEDNFQESVPSFYHVGPGDWTQVVMFGQSIEQAHQFISIFGLSNIIYHIVIYSIFITI